MPKRIPIPYCPDLMRKKYLTAEPKQYYHYLPFLLSLYDHLTKLPVVKFIVPTGIKLFECNLNLIMRNGMYKKFSNKSMNKRSALLARLRGSCKHSETPPW